MRELSLYVLDIAQNSIAAGATLIEIEVTEQTAADRVVISVRDNGCGMTPEQVKQAADPFYTTRTTRRVGMGIPFFRMAAEQASGHLDIASSPEEGTTVTAEFVRSHIDRAPLGDMADTVVALIRLNTDRDFCYRYSIDGRSFTVDTRALRKVLDDVSLDTPEVAAWIGEYIQEQNDVISGKLKPEETDIQ